MPLGPPRRFHDREDRLDREAIAYDRNDRVIANDREAKAIESEQPFPGTKHKHCALALVSSRENC